MKGISIISLLFIFIPILNARSHDRRIWFDTPCTSTETCAWTGTANLANAGDSMQNADNEWENCSLPIGNGSLGANVFGGISTERITFNEKTLWRGGPAAAIAPSDYWDVNKESSGILPEIRQALLEGRRKDAWEMLGENFRSTVPYPSTSEKHFRFGSYTTAGEFKIRTGIDEEGISGYFRELLLDSALVKVGFSHGGTAYNREYFVSYPSNILGASFSASKKGKQNLEIAYLPNPLMEGRFEKDGRHGTVYCGRLTGNGMKFVMRMTVKAEGGKVNVTDEGKIIVKGADSVVILVTADTDYKANYNPDFTDEGTYTGTDPLLTTARWMKGAVNAGYGKLKEIHTGDYRTLFSRVDFTLDGPSHPDLPSPKRLAAYRNGQQDQGLETLYYDFGRYLLTACSRPGNMPANLQGIWHNNVDGPWRVDYHNNINLQMNYWPACAANLAECEQPLFDFIRTLVEPGRRTAKAYFGADGWTASISGNIFGFTAPLDSRDMSWNYCPMAGPWLATHIIRHFDYTLDLDFLRENFEIVKGAADFTCGMLWENPEGHYTIAPSTSPEHGPVDLGATFANAVARDILEGAVRVAGVLGEEQEKAAVWKERLSNIVPYKTGRYGQLQEWSEDIDSPEDRHRHVNHLYGVHPGASISPVTDPELAEAAKVVLNHRGDGATGWSMGWKLNLWARLHDGDRAYKLYGNLLREGTNDNLWDRHPPFQIDGNFGGVSGITEMLLQSHAGCIHLLPALPSAWDRGHITGIRAVGNFTVDIYWKNGLLEKAVIHSGSGGKCTVRYAGRTLAFDTRPGESYSIVKTGEGFLKAES